MRERSILISSSGPRRSSGERAESGAELAEALDVGEGFGSGGEVRNRGGLGDFDLE